MEAKKADLKSENLFGTRTVAKRADLPTFCELGSVILGFLRRTWVYVFQRLPFGDCR